MNTIRFLFIFLFSALLIPNSYSQQTGDFDASVTFMNQNRTLSCHVPTTYDSTIKYRVIIGLHGLGDNSFNYRNALIGTLGWPNIFSNTIFIFPDGGSDQNKDFYAPVGDEGIIAECINYVKQNYSVDSTNIILQGFSLGGRSALKYGLENPTDFKGLLLTTPALQGLEDVKNSNNGGSLLYPYANASQVPIYITVGSTDDLYVSSINVLTNILKKNDAKVEFVSVNGVGHNMPNNNFISPCIPFFDNPATADYDLDVFEIDMPIRTCDPNVLAKCYVRNLGDQAITSLDIDYQLGSSNLTYNWTGNIGLYEHAVISLPQINASAGKQTLTVNIGQVNGSQSDPITVNNQLDNAFEVVSNGFNLPINEGFEANEDDWLFDETGSLFEWTKDDNVKRNGQSSIFSFNTILVFTTTGAVESFMSPVMDLSSVNKPFLNFDLAFNYHRYTPPYTVTDLDFADTLEVTISTDCGESFQTIYRRGGADLATVKDPILNPLTLDACFFSPSDSSEWRREIVDLSAFSSATEAVVKFNYISALGGSINIDNIVFDDGSVISLEEENKELKFDLFPNPAQNKITLIYDKDEADLVEIQDASGRLVYAKSLASDTQMTIDLSPLSNGLYTVKLSGNTVQSVQKLIVNK